MLYQSLIYELAKDKRFLSNDPILNSISSVKREECLDELKILITQIKPSIVGLKLKCEGCALMKASTNAICLAIEYKTKQDALLIIDNYLKMLNNQSYRDEILSENLKVLQPFKDSLTRRPCLLLAPEYLRRILNNAE